MMKPEDPPSAVIRIEAENAAGTNGFRLRRGIENGWLRFGSTTAKSEIWIGAVSKDGPWLFSVDRPEVGAEIGIPAVATGSGPGARAFVFDKLSQLYHAIDRTYRLSLSLPDLPLKQFQSAVEDLPRATEAERFVVQRIGQDLFRDALITYWGGRCPLTGIADLALLRASHIVPWAECGSDAKRLDVHNGLLLSALWDAAFDAGLVSFADDGLAVVSSRLTDDSVAALRLNAVSRLPGLTDAHQVNLAWHRSRYGF